MLTISWRKSVHMFIKEKVKQIDTFIFSLMLVSKFTHSSFSFGFGQGIHDLDLGNFCAFVFLVAQMVKRLPAMRETWVRSQGQEDPLEKEMATHSSTLAWKISWMEEPGRGPWVAKSRTRLSDFTFTFVFKNVIISVLVANR